MNSTTGLALFISHRTASGQRDAVRAVWERHMAPAIRDNPGHLAYYYCYDTSDEDVLRVFQLYRDRAASEAFLNHPNYAAYLAESRPLLASAPEIHEACPAWTKKEEA